MNKNTDIFDPDLNPVLEIATAEELDILVEYQKKKISQLLTIDEAYKKYAPDHTKYPDLIAKELRDFGGNTLINIFRGEGPSYHEIACDVAETVEAPFKKSQDIETIENAILSTILEKAWSEMSEEEKKTLLNELGVSNKSALKGAGTMLFQSIFKAGGFISYKLTLVISNQVAKFILGRGLPLAMNAALVRWASILTGPIGMTLTSLWTIIDFAGPSYKVTIPSVIYVAWLRKKYNSTFCENCKTDLPDSNMKFCPECGHKFS